MQLLILVHTCAPVACTYSRINLDAHEKASEERIRTLRFQADAAGMRAQRLMRARLRSPFMTYLLDIAGAISLYLPVLRDVSLYFADVVTDCMVMVQLYLVGELRFAGCYLAVLVLQMSLAYWTTLGHLELLVEEVAQAKRHASFSATPRQTTQRTLDQRGQHSVWFRWLGFPFGVLLLDVLALWQPVVDLLVAVLRKSPPLACSRSSRSSGEDIVADSAADSVSQRSGYAEPRPCYAHPERIVNFTKKNRESESVALVEDDSWKKWSSFNAASAAENQNYEPPSYVGQFSAEAAWEL